MADNKKQLSEQLHIAVKEPNPDPSVISDKSDVDSANLLNAPQANYYTELPANVAFSRSPRRNDAGENHATTNTTTQDDNSTLGSTMSGTRTGSMGVETLHPPMIPTKRRRSSLIEFIMQTKASIFSSGINICNANIGAGMLALPFAVNESGWLMGIILFVVFAFMSTFAFQLLMSVGACYCYRGHISSYAIVSDDIAPRLQIWIDLFIAFGYTLTCSAYLIIIADYMPLVMRELVDMDTHSDAIYLTRPFWIAIFVIFLIFPTTSLKKLDQLRFSSMIAIVCFIYLMVICIIYQVVDTLSIEDDMKGELNAFPKSVLSFFDSAPLYIFAYGGHPLAFILTNELENPTLKRINTTLIGSFSFVTMVYAVVGLFGYFTFGNATQSNILLNYPNGDIAIIVVRIGLSIAVAFSYPVIASPWKQSMASLLFHVDKEGKDATDLVWYKYYSLVVILIASTIVIAMVTDDLGIVSKLQGSTAGTFMQIMVPGLIYYYYDKRSPPDAFIMDNSMHNWKWRGAVVLIAFGAIMIPFGTALVFI